MSKKFPAHFNHYIAKRVGCSHCRADLSGACHERTGLPKNYGQFKIYCNKCEVFTYYDIDISNLYL